MPARRMPATSSQAKAGQPFHDQHAPGHQFGVRAGDDHGPLVRFGQDAGDVEHVVGLEAEVELLDDRLGEQLDQCRRVGQGGDRDPPDEVGGQPAHGGDIAPHEAGHLEALDLDHYLFAGAQPGRMDLGDGRGGNGAGIEALEDLAQAAGRGRLRPLPARPRSVSGGTRSRSSRNSPTSSGGKTPSPADRI